jgi:hydrogenase-4 component B
VSDPILLFLAVDIVALLMLGTCAALLPLSAIGFLVTGLCGMGTLLCLLPLLFHMPATALELPIGPPAMSLQLALDPLSAFFLLLVFLSGTAVAAFQATTVPLVGAASAQTASVRVTAICLAGMGLTLLAADGVALTIGMAVTCGSVWFPGRHVRAAILIPLLLLAAICLLTPAGFPPRFDTIRAAPIDVERATAAVVLTVAAAIGLSWGIATERCWTRNALAAGVRIPAATYLLLRLIIDLSGAIAQSWWGLVLLFAGGSIAIVQGWQAAAHPELDGSVACLMRRQTGMVMIGVGLALICGTADLPAAASFALASTLLLAAGGSLAGTVTSLAASAIGTSAGTFRLSRLGGLVHTMPGTSAALGAGLLALSALPPGLGFACLWLLFQSILSAPRTGGLFAQLPLAVAAAAIALSAALATAATVRLVGIALLGRPRSPRGSGAHESKSPTRIILLVMAGIAIGAGILPGQTLWLLTEPALLALVGVVPLSHTGFSVTSAAPGYLPLPVLALLVLATGAVTMAQRRKRKEVKIAGPWTNGMTPPLGLPFGEPAAQSTGEGFLPALPDNPLPALPQFPKLPSTRKISAAGGVWVVIGAFGALLLVLAVAG